MALGMVLLGLALVALLFLLPLRGGSIRDLGTPRAGVDERDVMFSRAKLVPGTDRHREYYRRHPEKKAPDDAFRAEPGLLQPGTSQYHPWVFPAADAAFWTMEAMRPFVGDETGRADLDRGAETPVPLERDPKHAEARALTRFLKSWTLKMGAHSAGVTEVRDYHLYSHAGRGESYGEPVRLDHPMALAFTVEMDREMVETAPGSPTVLESAHQYLRSGMMAVQLAALLRRGGYRARAHVDGNYRVICPLVARDAGLGEIGRMGLLMTPRLGPRVRIAVVTTDAPLSPDPPRRDLTVIDFCLHCRKCADVCPSQALPLGDPEEDGNGVRRWKIDAEACFTLWTRLGTDCARCMAACPYSHPDNALHNAIRWGIRTNALFRRAAVWMDDVIYGRRPPPSGLPAWIPDSWRS
jgi:reductive dehalogenase